MDAFRRLSQSIAKERSKEFPDLKCRYTLAGEDWKWMDSPGAANIFMATDGSHVVTLASMQIPASNKLDESFIEGFEKSMYQSGKFKRQGGRMRKFLGFPCYQFEFEYAASQMGAGRVLLANGKSYQLMVLGNKAPVEHEPDFEKIMGGFALIGAQMPISKSADATPQSEAMQGVLEVSRIMGGLVVVCLLAAVLIVALRWVIKKANVQK